MRKINLTWFFIFLGLFFIIFGLYFGEVKILLKKATNICLSCMGIG